MFKIKNFTMFKTDANNFSYVKIGVIHKITRNLLRNHIKIYIYTHIQHFTFLFCDKCTSV